MGTSKTQEAESFKINYRELLGAILIDYFLLRPGEFLKGERKWEIYILR
jgi:hypothetical protein